MRAAQACEDDVKRRLLIIGMFLLLGAVVNVAVAWGCAVLVDPFVVEPEYRGAMRTVRGSPVDWRVWAWTRMGVKHIHSMMGSARSVRGEPDPTEILPYWLDFAELTTEHKASKNLWEVRRIDGRGWPAISMWCELERTYWRKPYEIVPIQGGIETGLPDWCRGPFLAGLCSSAKRVLPLRPIWPGYAVNTFFYAAILWLLILGPFAVRRFLRLKRGLCPRCAYPIGESSVCTECGGAVLPGRALRD